MTRLSPLCAPAAACAVLVALSLWPGQRAIGDDETGAIVGQARVVDGDTIAIGEVRVRMDGIDAPESDQMCGQGDATWECGQTSADHLRSLLEGGETRCTWEQTDRYKRPLGTCWSHDGTQVNSAMVEDGMAVAYMWYTARYKPEQERAQEAKKGVWSGPFKLPWEHRGDRRRKLP